MASTRYPDNIEIHKVKIESQPIASHWVISTSSSSESSVLFSRSFTKIKEFTRLKDSYGLLEFRASTRKIILVQIKIICGTSSHIQVYVS